MAKCSLSQVVRHCDRLLRPERFEDYAGAWNGLQAENRGQVRRVAAAVDASVATVTLAAEAGADLLVVHHGLFWGATLPWTGHRLALLRLLLGADMAVYSSHLPLDAHPRLGNSVRLCGVLGLRRLRPFFLFKGRHLGFRSDTPVRRQELAKRLAHATGRDPVVVPAGPVVCRRIGVVTGGGGSELKQVVAEGVDTFITGEGPHWTYALAEDLGVNVLYGGHYATETFGVKALAVALSRQFGLPWTFIDHPTGL